MVAWLVVLWLTGDCMFLWWLVVAVGWVGWWLVFGWLVVS